MTLPDFRNRRIGKSQGGTGGKRGSLRSFVAEVAKATDREVPGLVAETHQALHLEGLRGIVLATPVREGRARGSWQSSSTGKVSGSATTLVDPTGAKAISRGTAVAARIKPFTRSAIGSNLIYVPVLEAGSSKQAPNGMVQVTRDRLNRARF